MVKIENNSLEYKTIFFYSNSLYSDHFIRSNLHAIFFYQKLQNKNKNI